MEACFDYQFQISGKILTTAFSSLLLEHTMLMQESVWKAAVLPSSQAVWSLFS